MTLRFERVQEAERIDFVAKVADEIWHEYWPALIGRAQTDYMVDTMQSAEAIAHDIAERDYRYYLLWDEEGTCIGYTAAAPEDITGHSDDPGYVVHGTKVNQVLPGKRLFISKIYLYAQERGKHYASRVIEFYEAACHAEGMSGMYLTVNRGNELGVRAYLGRGFVVVEELAADIGEGFVMDDYIMAKLLEG